MQEIKLFCALFGICLFASAFINSVDGNNVCPKNSFEIIVLEYVADNSCEATDDLKGLYFSILWDNGLKSNVTYNVFCVKHNGNFSGVITAIVTSGPCMSSSLRLDIAFPDISQDCKTSVGLTEVTGKAVGYVCSKRITCVDTIRYSPGITNIKKPTKASFDIKCNFLDNPTEC